MIVEPAHIRGRRLFRNDRFSFRCHPGLSCFNRCCRNKDLPLSPYDVLRLKSALGIDSDEFLRKFVLYRVDGGSGFPVLSLRPRGPERLCPFVTEKGCSVYEDRPAACRLFPLGRSCRPRAGEDRVEEFFYLLEMNGCLGILEPRPLSVEEWIQEQGLEVSLEMDDRMLELLFHPARDPERPLGDDQLRQVLVACYNLDRFREFLASSRFFETMVQDRTARARILLDGFELLRLGIAYLRQTLFSR